MKHYTLDERKQLLLCEDHAAWTKWMAENDTTIATTTMSSHLITTTFIGVDSDIHYGEPAIEKALRISRELHDKVHSGIQPNPGVPVFETMLQAGTRIEILGRHRSYQEAVIMHFSYIQKVALEIVYGREEEEVF